ncbi:MAG: 50S ribosomal protein L9 [Candidatus Omnitrophota bacterium]
MEVILLKDVEKIGKQGTVIKVKDGFARNFLLPNSLAVEATTHNLKKIQQDQEKKKVFLEKQKKELEVLAQKISKLSFTIKCEVHAEEELYGSVGAQEIVRVLKDEGIDVEKENILLNEPIKKLGIYDIPIKLHPEVSSRVKVWVVKK